MRKLILCVLAVLAISIAAVAQKSRERDVVYLKNGSVVYGKIIEQVMGKNITIQTSDGSRFVYSIDEVEKLSRTEFTPKKSFDRLSFYSFNLGFMKILDNDLSGVSVSLADMNFHLDSGFGIVLKANGNGIIKDGSSLNFGTLGIGPSYSTLSPDETVAFTVSLFGGLSHLTDGDFSYQGYYYGAGTSIRFFADKRWNLITSLELSSTKHLPTNYLHLNIRLGFAYNW
ncbi:MAG: hypothetical protein Q3998_01765 [Porphyromonas sp.]|nr:hypothetical protein [Porphyromonas sp.]